MPELKSRPPKDKSRLEADSTKCGWGAEASFGAEKAAASRRTPKEAGWKPGLYTRPYLLPGIPLDSNGG
jgi:hypothetical protein